MEAVLDAVRRITMRWVQTRTPLTVSASVGDTSITVRSTRRFKVGDQFLITNDDEDIENLLYVRGISGRHTILIGDENGNARSLRWAWPLSGGAKVMKTIDNMLVKAVFLGDPDIIELGQLPAVTVSAASRASEPMTFRATKERFNVEINVYVSGSTQEEGDRFLLRMVDQIQYGLKRNFYPLLNDYETTTLAADIETGDQHIRVADRSILPAGRQIVIEDDYNIEVHSIFALCDDDSETIQLCQVVDNDFDKDDTVVILPNRLPFNSWPSDIQYGKIKKGTLLKAATISYFVEEMEDHPDASFGDTQLQ